MAAQDKISILFQLGETDPRAEWPDYLQYGFDESDVPGLLALLADESLFLAGEDSKEAWVPVHAWRTLGQIGSANAIAPLIALFDRLVENDDWVLNEFPAVIGMFGGVAIDPLADYINQPQHDEFARAMVTEGLVQITKRQPECRERVVECLRDYLANPDERADIFNGVLIACLVALDAWEAMADIRWLFEQNCVDITSAGDLEDVEIALGFRTARDTPKPDDSVRHAQEAITLPEPPRSDDLFEVLDNYLIRYGNDDSVLDVSELDGFFAALACAPQTVMPSSWMPAIWGGEAQVPEWQSKNELEQFSQAVFVFYNQVMEYLLEEEFEAIFLEKEIEGNLYNSVDEWCRGFMRGLNLWGPLSASDAALTETCIEPLRLFATPAGFEILDTLSEDEVIARQELIEPAVRRLYRYFLDQRKLASMPVVHESPKVGRNDPCPCGSGKKFKKCCLH